MILFIVEVYLEMKKFDSFEKYLEDQYYNEIFKGLKSYIYQNRSRLNLSSNVVQDPRFVELDNFHVMDVTYREVEEDRILFRAAVEADITISGKSRRDYEQDMVNPWFAVSITGVLNDGLHDVIISDISEYSKEKFCAEGALTKWLVPILYKDQLDGVAESFLQKFYPEALIKPIALPVQAVVRRMVLIIQQSHLSKN
jgi:hypothetical protein